MKKRIYWLLILSLGLVSCSTNLTSVAPIQDPSGVVVVLKPSRFAVNEKTRGSAIQRLGEDIIAAMPANFPSNLIPLDPDRGEAVVGSFYLVRGSVTEKGQKKPTGVLVPFAVVNSQNVPQARIDAAFDAIQRAYYRQLRKHGRLIKGTETESYPSNGSSGF